MNARGYSIAELLVALVIAGIVGIALSKLIINQSRFLQSQDNYRQARSGARSALTIPTDELRMVTSSGDSSVLIQASKDSFSVRVPIAYGIVCGQSGGSTHIALFPTDSATYANATPTGYVWRDFTGMLHFVRPITSVAAGSATVCSSAVPAIAVLSATGWPATVVAVQPSVLADSSGSVAYLYRQIRYVFATSGQLPGRRALWRVLVPANTRDELVAPFDTSAHFEYLVGDALVPTQTPAVLDSVEGVRFVMVSASQQNAPGGSAPVTFNLTTDILFRNRALH
ncbi:MAG: PilW family protein [Solirubrobacterales bacterium]